MVNLPEWRFMAQWTKCKIYFFLDAPKTLNVPGDCREAAAKSQGANLHLPLSTPLICLGLSLVVTGTSYPDTICLALRDNSIREVL